MNISSSRPAATPVEPRQPSAAAAGGEHGQNGIGSKEIKLLESDSQAIRSEGADKKADAGILAGKSPTRLNEKIEPELQGLIMAGDEKNGKFMGRIRSLAKNAMKMFACTNPNSPGNDQAVSYSSLSPDAHLYAEKKAAAGAGPLSPYRQFAEGLSLTGTDNIVTYMNLGLLDDFHNNSRSIPEIARQLSESGPESLTAQLTRRPGLLQQVLVPASSMESIYEADNAYSIVQANPDIPAADSDLLAQHMQEAALATTNALEESYTPKNPQLRQLVEQMPAGATKLHQFGNSENNPYQLLSGSEHFTAADDQHLRSWLTQGLQVVDKGSKIMQAVMFDQDTSLTILGDLYQFTHLDETQAASS